MSILASERRLYAFLCQDFARYILAYFRTQGPDIVQHPRVTPQRTLLPIFDINGCIIGYTVAQAAHGDLLPASSSSLPAPPTHTPFATTAALPSQSVPSTTAARVLAPVPSKPLMTGTLSSKTPAISVPDWDGWPDGDFERLFTHEEVDAMNHLMAHWAANVSGDRKGNFDAEEWGDGKKSQRRCLGAIVCDNDGCNIIVRPQTRLAGIRKQLDATCRCGGVLVRIEYMSISVLWTFKGGIYFVNKGTHSHPRLTHLLHLSPSEHAQFNAIMAQHPNVGPLRLVAGVPGLHGSGQSVADISPVLLNKDRVKMECQKLKHGDHGGDGFIADFAEFCKEHPSFVIYSQLAAVTVISMQTSLMRAQMVKDSIIGESINGLVSDAAHGFWQEHKALLIITSSYAPDLQSWMPGLMSYSNGASTEHYKLHFYALFESIAHEAEDRTIAIMDRLFSGVIDFSEAEHGGFIAAFVQFWNRKDEDTRTAAELRDTAATLLRGCRQHFRAGITRVKAISGVIPPGAAHDFQSRAEALLHVHDVPTFLTDARLLVDDYPAIRQWLSWWLCEEHAMMLFDAHRCMEPAIWDSSIPDTTNAEEAMHWKLYTALGQGHTVMSGIHSLYSFANLFGRQIADVLGKHY
ncbi:hypothetical protein A0H81_05700 [Grifola frondosa]|uniref:Uncharacterized protein n=1 Tax=Grifola frondosa TaxID=5627 RepID=A0A1C7MCX5_GRIFR|nr:hypothetical protein A0H81_05700 [Grifola frondosa]